MNPNAISLAKWPLLWTAGSLNRAFGTLAAIEGQYWKREHEKEYRPGERFGSITFVVY